MSSVEARIDQLLRDGAELKSQVFHLRTDVARSSSVLKRATIATGVFVVLAILLGFAGFGTSSPSAMDGAHESGKASDRSMAVLGAEIQELRTTMKNLNNRLDSQPGKAAAKTKLEAATIAGAQTNCANLPADIGTSAVDFSIPFALGSAKISPESEATLDNIAKMLALAPDRCVLVEGYSDATGIAERNLALSRERANSVANYIAEKGGIKRHRLVPLGKGASSSAPDFDPSDPRNRRVVFQVVTDPALAVR